MADDEDAGGSKWVLVIVVLIFIVFSIYYTVSNNVGGIASFFMNVLGGFVTSMMNLLSAPAALLSAISGAISTVIGIGSWIGSGFGLLR